MVIKLKSVSRSFLAPVVLFLVAACAPTPYLFLQYGPELKEVDLAKVLSENPLPANENIKVTNLGQAQGMSHHVVQIRDRESPHIHRTHDGTVVMIRGAGYLMMEKRRIRLSVGDIVYIPRGVAHYFINTASEPSAAFVVFAPPFDGKDNVPVKAP
jgi:mannose-6-phosphate isomerase-like protein (cupin superfamily)